MRRLGGSKGRPGHRIRAFCSGEYFQVDAIHEKPFAICKLAGLPTGGAARVLRRSRKLPARFIDRNHARTVAGRCSLRVAHRHPNQHGPNPYGDEAAGPARRAPCRNPTSQLEISARRRPVATQPAARQETLS